MNQPSILANIQRSLKGGPATLEHLLAEHAALWRDLGWQASQVNLWLACTPAVQQCKLPDGETAWALDGENAPAANNLGDELVALLHKAGHPMPLAQLISKLPPGMVVTEPMLRAAAQQDARLELKGPLLKLV